MFTATIAEILHAKSPAKFVTLMARLMEAGLLNARTAADSNPEPATGLILVNGRRYEPAEKAA